MGNSLYKIFRQKYSKYVTSNFDMKREKTRENNRFRQSKLISFDYCSHLEGIFFFSRICLCANNTTFTLMNTQKESEAKFFSVATTISSARMLFFNACNHFIFFDYTFLSNLYARKECSYCPLFCSCVYV